jgi:hypothetical protein
MTDPNSEDRFEMSGRVVTMPGNKPKAGSFVTAIGLDYEAMISVAGLLGADTTDDKGRFSISIEQEAYRDFLGTDGRARILFQAYADDDLSGVTIQQIKGNKLKVDVTIPLTGASIPEEPAPGGPGATGGNDNRGGREGRGGRGKSAGAAQDELIGEVIDAITGIGGRPSGGTGTRSAGAGTDLDRLFDDAMFRVLGARVRPDQPRDLRTAFDRVFVEKEVEGRSEVEYRGTSGTASLPIEPGTVTSGPQAVIYRRARAELDVVRQALAELEADDDDDQDEFEAVRDVVDRKLVELVGALGQEVRPAIARVDAAFALLRGVEGEGGKGSALRRLGKLVGFQGGGDLIDEGDITRDEDRASTRFLEVEFYVSGLYANWQKIKDQFGNPDVSAPLGTRLDVLGMRLDRVAEATDDLDVALTAVSVDLAEREFLEISDDPPTSLAELMDWLREFATTGKSFDSGPGIDAVRQTAADIRDLVDCAYALGENPDGPRALRYRRVRRALADLSDTLVEIECPGNAATGSGYGQTAGMR